MSPLPASQVRRHFNWQRQLVVSGFLIAALPIVWLAGCGGSPPLPVHAVSGKLLVGTSPARNACIALHPMGVKSGGRRPTPVGITGDDGSFGLTTRSADDGAPAGEYAVTIVWLDESQPLDACLCPTPLEHDRLRGAYSNPATSPFHATIHPGQNELFFKAPY